MSIKSFIIGAATLASVALPGVASAQNYGYYGGGNGYYGAPSRYDGYYNNRYDDRRYDARERHDDRRYWREVERRRRWEWRHRHEHRDGYYGTYGDGYRY